MKKFLVLLSSLFLSVSVNASILDELKKTPASKYEVGILQLELAAYMLNEKSKDQKLKGTNFKHNGFGVEQELDKIYFKMSLLGKAKELTNEFCLGMKEATQSSMPKIKMMRDIWSGLSDKQYESLSNSFLFKVELVSKENNNFKISC